MYAISKMASHLQYPTHIITSLNMFFCINKLIDCAVTVAFKPCLTVQDMLLAIGHACSHQSCFWPPVTPLLLTQLRPASLTRLTLLQLTLCSQPLTARRMWCAQDDEHIHSTANSTANRIHAVAEYLSDLRPRSQVLLVALLPRGDLTLSADQHLAQPSK